MKKNFLQNLWVLLALLLVAPQASAIITDPNDYIIYDTGIMADSTHATDFVFPEIMKITSGVTTKKINVVGRSVSDVVSLGYPASTDAATLRGKVNIWGIDIAQDGANTVVYDEYLKLSDSIKALGWTLCKTTSQWSRPSDSIVIRVPKTCDSIFIQAAGSNSYYGVLVYELSQGRSQGYYNGGNWGAFFEVGFKPKHLGLGDSTDIVILGPHKDWFADNTKSDKTEWGPSTGGLHYIPELVENTTRPRYIKAERWGLWAGISINRIKVFGKIEKGSVPEFEGTVSAWSNLYMPKTSGTVDLTKEVKELDGMMDTRYQRYASDLGVIRLMMTTSTDEGLRMGYDNNYNKYVLSLPSLDLPAGTIDFTDGSKHTNYYQIAGNFTGFQDLTLDFDFAIRDGADTCVVAYLLSGASNWEVAGKFVNSGDPWNETVHASVDLSALENQAEVSLRILMGSSADETSGSEMLISNVKISGFDDFYPSNDDAMKVAYINNAVSRIQNLDRATTADSLDMILRTLLEDEAYRVSIFTQAECADITEANVEDRFADFDVVVISNFADSKSNVVKACKKLVGKKPLLNLGANLYGSDSWNWNSSSTVSGNADGSFVFDHAFNFHPIFSGITVSGDTTAALFDTIVGATGLYGYDKPSYSGFTGGYEIATLPSNSQVIAIQELNENPAAKFIFMPISTINTPSLNNIGKKMITNALIYLAKNAVYVAPDFNMVSNGAIVENMAELKAALSYDFTALGLSEVSIQLKNSTDEGTVYQLNEKMNFSKLGKLTIKSYNDAKPVIKGSFAAKNELDLTGLIFQNLTFEASNSTDALFCLKAGDTINGTFLVEKCAINNLKGQNFLHTESADRAFVQYVQIQNNVIDNFGGSDVEGPAFIALGDAAYELDSFLITQNTFTNFHGASFFDCARKGTTAADSSMNFKITSNLFYKYSGTASSTGNFFNFPNDPKAAVAIHIDNNLFYGTSGNTGNYSSNVNLFTVSDTASVCTQGNFFEPSQVALQVVGGEGFTKMENHTTMNSLGITSVFLDESAFTISKGSKLYYAGENYAKVGPSQYYVARDQSSTIRVKNAPELRVALEVAIGGDVIELENCSDTVGVYLLGSAGFSYPQTFGNLVVKAAQGHSPKLFGRISPNNGCKLDNLVFEGLTFIDKTTFEGFDKDAYSPFYFAAADSIKNEFVVKNCKFIDLDNQMILRVVDNANNLYINKVIYTNNYFDNLGGTRVCDGKTWGAHLMQFGTKVSCSIDDIVFENNVIKNYHGNQVFNITRLGTTRADSTISIKINNNLFYRVGGHTGSARNFLEFTKEPVGCDVNIDINDNMFYERWSGDYYAISNLALFQKKDSTTKISINVKNNYFEGEYYTSDETYGDNPMAQTDAIFNLPATATNIEVNYENHPQTRSSLDLNEVFFDLNKLLIDTASKLYTAGSNGKQLGPDYCYINTVSVEEVSGVAPNRISTKNGVLYIQSDKVQSVNIYNVLGKLVFNGQLNKGTNTIEGLSQGQLYLVKTAALTEKVVL